MRQLPLIFIVKLNGINKKQEILMNFNLTPIIVLLLTILAIAGCSSTPEIKDDPYNSADDQRSRAKQAQDELSSETFKK